MAAESFARALLYDRADEARKSLTPEAARSLPAGMLREFRAGIEKRDGALQRLEAARPDTAPQTFRLRATFARAPWDLVVGTTTDKNGAVRIMSLSAQRLGKARQEAAARESAARGWQPPEGVELHEITEITEYLRAPGLPLQIKSAAPAKPTNRLPAVLILADRSAPDPDGTVGGSMPLRDIALWLAARGVASIRMPVRTEIYRDRYPSSYTIEEEYLGDARIALEQLRKSALIDPDRIGVLGVGTGGIAALLLAHPKSGISSVALLGTPVMLTAEWIFAREVALGRFAGTDELSKNAFLARAGLALNGDLPPDDLIAGVPAGWWADAGKRPAPGILARDFGGRLTLLFGEKDASFPVESLAPWRSLATRNPRVRFRLVTDAGSALLRVSNNVADSSTVHPEALRFLTSTQAGTTP